MSQALVLIALLAFSFPQAKTFIPVEGAGDERVVAFFRELLSKD